MPLLVLAMMALPLIEIALLIAAGRAIGILPVLAIVVVTALAGIALLRRQGAGTAGDVARAMREMRDPAGPLAHGALRMLAGALLVLPGLLADALGLLLLLPPVRAALIGRLRRRMRAAPGPQPHRPGRGMVIDGEFVEVEAPMPAPGPAPGPRRPSGWTRP